MSSSQVTETAAFKRWFKDSYVSDGRGRPLVVYHGSPDVRGLFNALEWGKDSSGRTVFVPAKGTGKGVWGPGFAKSSSRGSVFFATDSYEMANSYTDPNRAMDYQGAEPGVVPLYLSIQNPMVVHWGGRHWKGTERIVSDAQTSGYDGIIIHDVMDFYSKGSMPKRAKSCTVYVFFKPEQAKSALEGPMISRVDRAPIAGAGPNIGTFDPSDSDMRKNPGGKMDQVDDNLVSRLDRDGYDLSEVRVVSVHHRNYPRRLLYGVIHLGRLVDVFSRRRDGKFQRAYRYDKELADYVVDATPNPKIGPMMEGFSDLVSHKRTDMEFGRIRVELAERDEDEDLTLDILRLHNGRSVVAVAAGELGRLPSAGLVFSEHNTFVPAKHRGKGYMGELYRELLSQGATIVSDVWNHSLPMRRTWMSLSKNPGIFVFADAPGQTISISNMPENSSELDHVMLAVKANSFSEAKGKFDHVMSEIGTEYSPYAIDDYCRFVD